MREDVESAEAAGLRHVSDSEPGIARRRAGAGFRYFTAEGRELTDEAALRRIRSLAIPPAWRDVWICASDDGHLQATGRDARGRKQYRYHPRWREVRDETKYHRMAAFGSALPRIRRRVERDLALPGLPRAKILAAVVRLLETTLIRVGNEEYARENESFGLTTLRNRQVRVNGSKVRFEFRGKSGVHHRIELEDRRMAAIVRRIRDLPGYELFQYLDENGERHTVESSDVNDYVRQTAGEAFTSKDFRTWSGTVLAATALLELSGFRSAAEAQRNVGRAIEAVARLLGNTKAVCRKCYVHPAVIDTYLQGRLPQALGTARAARRGGLRPEERAVLALLEEALRREMREARRRRDRRGLVRLLARSIPKAQRAAAAARPSLA